MPKCAVSTTTSSSITAKDTRESKYLEDSPKLCKKQDFLARHMNPLLRQQSEMLSHNMWLHPFETRIGETPPLTRMGSLHYFYLDNTEHTEQKGITLLCIERTRSNGCNGNTMSHSTTSHRGILPCTGQKETNRYPQTSMY